MGNMSSVLATRKPRFPRLPR